MERGGEPGWTFDLDRVLFHGGGILVIDKPPGVPVHRGTGHAGGVVESIAVWVSLNPGVLDVAAGKRIHPVQLMDREASGVLVLALSRAAARRAKAAFAEGRVERVHLAVVAGPLEPEGVIDGRLRAYVRGRTRELPARLGYRVLRGDERSSLVEVVPAGGGHHLVRSLFAQIGRPLAGDLRYGKPKPSRLFLERFGTPFFLVHAFSVTLPEDVLGTRIRFEAPVPEGFRSVCRKKGWEDALPSPAPPARR